MAVFLSSLETWATVIRAQGLLEGMTKSTAMSENIAYPDKTGGRESMMIKVMTRTEAGVTEAEAGMVGMMPEMRASRLDTKRIKKGVGAVREIGKRRTESWCPHFFTIILN